MTIQLNGDPFDLDGPISVAALLARLQIDPRRVAVELNLVVLKRATFDTTVVQAGDSMEIVNFVGGGAPEAGR
ncbi:MAG: sulfur carrier protein ThiS [Acidobacteria bacterium]|nr:sulfur carrier protein ThiS [Acidobacteriota bacterium]